MKQEDVKQPAWEEIFESGLGNMRETAVRVYAICFLGAALLMSTPSYAAEVAGAPYVECVKRVFIGVPNQLTLPPESPGPVDSSDSGSCEEPPHIDAANSFESPKNLSEKDSCAVETPVHATIYGVQTRTRPASVVHAEPVHPF